MNDRQAKILEIIIKEYVDTSFPVGSNAVVSKYGLRLSPATVRLDMAHLEKEGYIHQPHTSAGRVPTDKGYRWFVSSFIDPETPALERERTLPSQREQKALKKKLSAFSDIEQTLKMAANLLSQLSSQAALATLPSSEVYHYGIANILRQPEFEDRLIALSFADLIDNLEEFLKELPQIESEIIYIGQENPFLKKASCSMIVSPYQYKDSQGVLGLVGPTRMNYDTNLSLLDFVTSTLKEF